MSEEIQKLKDAIEAFFDKKDVALESRYFILKDMEMDYLDQILNEDDDEDDEGVEDLDDGFEDADEDADDEPEFEDLEDEEVPDSIPDLDLPDEVRKVPRVPVGKHGSNMKQKLMKRPVMKKPKVKVKE